MATSSLAPTVLTPCRETRKRLLASASGLALLILACLGMSQQQAAAAIGLTTAHWLGQTDNLWSGANWASDADGTPSVFQPYSGSSVTFSALGAGNLSTTLDTNVTILNLTVQDTIVISGGNSLTVSNDTLVNTGGLTLNGGVTLSSASSSIGTYVGQTATVFVSDIGTNWTTTGDLNVGFQGLNSTLRVENGGLVGASYTKIGGYVGATGNAVTVSGTGSSLNNTNDLIIGYGGNGSSFTLEGGATATNVNGFLGHRFDPSSSSNNNTATITGTGSLWTNTGTLYLGDYGSGNTLTIADGGKVDVTAASQDTVVGHTLASTGNTLIVTGAGSEFANDATFYLGKAGGTNTLTVQEGATMTTRNVRIGGDATSSGNIATVTGASSNWNISGTALRVGSLGSSNTLNILDGGTVTVSTGNTFIGHGAGSTGNSVLISGTGSVLDALDVYIGRAGTGSSLTVADGGLLYAGAVIIAEQAGSSGALNIGNGGIAGSVDVYSIEGGDGTAMLNFNHTNDIEFAAQVGGNLSITKSGSGITSLVGIYEHTGTTTVESGVLALGVAVLLDVGSVTVAHGAMLAGEGIIYTAEDQSITINGGLNVQGLANAPSLMALDTYGTGATIMGAGSFIALDLFTGAGLGDNTLVPGSSDILMIGGTLDATAGTTLIIGNPTGLTGFAIGDQWMLISQCGCGLGMIGDFGLNLSALGLARGIGGEFDKTTGYFKLIDISPQVSAETGLAIANAQDQAMLASMQTILNDINGRLFGLRAGGGEEGIGASLNDGVVEGQGDGPEDAMARRVAASRQWEVYATVNYSNISLSGIGSQAGVDSQTWAPGVGIERHLSRHWAVGFAASLLETHQTYANNLGTLDIEGVAFSAYASYVRGGFWGDALYSFGRFDLQSDRNPGFAFPMAQGETTAWTNAVQFNTGWNFRFLDNTLTTGPFVGIDYLHVAVDNYSEAGGGAAALAFAKRDVDSLVTRLGWSVSKRVDTDFATITPQLSVSYERQNISNNNGTSVNLINQPFTASANGQAPGQDYLVAAAGIKFQFTEMCSLLLSYQGQFFRENMQAHYGGVRLSYKF